MMGHTKQISSLLNPFAKQTLRSFPHHALLASASKTRHAGLTRAVSSLESRKLERLLLKTYSQQQINEYSAVVSGTCLWHGTGRLQYAPDGLRDVLVNIIHTGGIAPARDVYGVLVGRGVMTTISASPQRMIARSYADTHGKGRDESFRYGDSLYWAAYFYSLFYVKLFLLYSVKVAKNWRSWKRQASNGTAITWGHKVNRSAKGLWDVFSTGSDIPGNYPIVFGIRRCSGLVRMPYIGKGIEVRIAERVRLEDLSHIEVPEVRVQEVRSLLAEHKVRVPVYAIELGERVASQQDHHQLVGR